MKARLIILIAVAGALAVYFATRQPADPAEADTLTDSELTPERLAEIRLLQTPLGNRPLAGQEPAEPPEFDIQLEVDPTGEKNRLYIYLTEAHGYYAETFWINFYFKPTPDTTYRTSPLALPTEIIEDYIKANETYRGCVEFVPAELDDVGGGMGTTANWGADFVRCGRARMENPDPLPIIADAGRCQ